MSPDRQEALSTRFLDNCDFIESRLLENRRFFAESQDRVASAACQVCLNKINLAVEENLLISGRLGTFPFERFAGYLDELNRRINTILCKRPQEDSKQLQGEKLSLDWKQAATMARRLEEELRLFQAQREQLVQHYLKLIQNANYKKISGTGCNFKSPYGT